MAVELGTPRLVVRQENDFLSLFYFLNLARLYGVR